MKGNFWQLSEMKKKKVNVDNMQKLSEYLNKAGAILQLYCLAFQMTHKKAPKMFFLNNTTTTNSYL